MKNLKLKCVNKPELASSTSFATVEQLVKREKDDFTHQASEAVAQNNIEQPVVIETISQQDLLLGKKVGALNEVNIAHEQHLSQQVKDVIDKPKINDGKYLSIDDQLAAIDKKIGLINGRNHHESVAHIIAALEPKVRRGLKSKHMWLHYLLATSLLASLLMVTMLYGQLGGAKATITERTQTITSLENGQKSSTASFNQIITEKEASHTLAMKMLNAKYIKAIDYGSDQAIVSARVKALISVQDADIDKLKKKIRILEGFIASKNSTEANLAWLE